MFKVSQYTYKMFNDNHELLLYNSSIGSSSFCKINSIDTPRINALLSNNHSGIDLSNDSVLIELAKRGFIVDEQFDENMPCHLLYLKAVNNRELHLVINPTDSCNFKCIYCYENELNSCMSDETQNSIVNFVKRNIKNFEGLNVSWFGGEPLLRLDIIKSLSEKFINICHQAKRSYISTITTNGYLLTADTLKSLLRLKIIHYQITLDGPSKTHDMQRPLKNGMGTFDTIFKNLIDINNQCRHSIYHISLRTNFTSTIYPYLEEYLNLIEKHFADNSHFDILIRVADDWGGERIKGMQSKLIADDRQTIRNIITLMKNHKLKFNLMRHMFDPGNNFCYAAKINSYSINSSGEISKCTTDLKLNPDLKIGDVTSSDFLINKAASLKWIIPYENTCSCFFKPVCLGIRCPKELYKHKIMSQNENKNNIGCPFERNYINDLFLLFDNSNMFPLLNLSS